MSEFLMEERKRILQAALSKDCSNLDEYDQTVFVVAGSGVGHVVLADSETVESAKPLVERVRSYGEVAFYYEWDPENDSANGKKGS